MALPMRQPRVAIAGRVRARGPASAPCGPSAHKRLRCSAADPSTPPAALLLELEGAVIDMHDAGHRPAFNTAFQDLGYDCVHWPPHVYNDLLSVGDGTPEGLLNRYFEMAGWPVMLATSERPAFLRKVHAAKQAALTSMLGDGGVPLRDGVATVVADALRAGAAVVFVTGTACEASDAVAHNALAQLPPDVAARVRVYASGAVPQDMDGDQQQQGDAPAPGLLQTLRENQARAKQQVARAFVAGVSGGVGVQVAPTLLDMRRVSPDWLAAVVATLGVPLARCVVVAASRPLLDAAAAAGMLAVAVPRRFAQRGSYDAVAAKFEGYGAGECTWPRLSRLLRLM